MPGTDKLSGGIIGTTVCLILLMAVALPITGAMIATVDEGELGPGQVTESGSNAFDSSLPMFNYVAPPEKSSNFGWAIVKASSGWNVRYGGPGGASGSSSTDSYTMIVSASSAAESGRITASSDTVTIELGGISHVYSLITGDSVNVGLMWAPPFSAYVLTADATIVDSGGTHIYPYQFDGVSFVFAQHVEGMPAATHGFVSGSPSAVIGDGIADSKAFKLDVATGNSRLAIDMTDAIGFDQRVFLLDNGTVLDLDDAEQPVKALPRGEIGGPVLKTSRAVSYTAVMVQRSSVTDLGAAADATSQYSVSWGEYQAPNDLEVPLLESVSKGGSTLSGWYVPVEWQFTGMGTVMKESMIHTVLSIVPLILVVALVILVARWMQAESGSSETDALLGGGRLPNDGWRDRR